MYVTPVGSPERGERAILGMILAGCFLVNSGRICGRGAALWCRSRNPLLNPNTFTQGHLMKIEWLFDNVTDVGSPDRAEHDILGVILPGHLLVDPGNFVIGKPLCDARIPFWSLITLLGAFNENWVVACQCNSCLIPWQSGRCYFGDAFGRFFSQFNQALFVVGEPLCIILTPSWVLITLLRITFWK